MAIYHPYQVDLSYIIINNYLNRKFIASKDEKKTEIVKITGQDPRPRRGTQFYIAENYQ